MTTNEKKKEPKTICNATSWMVQQLRGGLNLSKETILQDEHKCAMVLHKLH